MRAIKWKIVIGRDRMYAPRDENRKATNNIDEIVIIVDKFCAQLYYSDASPENISYSSDLINVEALAITKGEVEHALKRVIRGKAVGEDGITVDVLKDGGFILLEKLVKLYARCL